MHIKYSPLIRYVKGDGISRAEREVKVTSMNLEHNHGLNKGMLIKAKRSTHQYAISLEVAKKIMEMLDSGPLPTKTLRSFLQKQVPNTMKISSSMVCNVKVKAKKLQSKYGNNIYNIPSNEIRRVFHENSLEEAPENWHSDPTFAKVFKESMMEVLG